MALIVETGVGAADAESYASVAAFKAYCDAMGYTYEGKSDLQIEQALRRGTIYLDGAYFGALSPSYQLYPASQALQWPRVGARYRNGYSVLQTIVPTQVIKACCEAALRELNSPGSLAPDVTPGKIKKSVAIEGAVSVEYANTGTAEGQRPRVAIIDHLLAALFYEPQGSSLSMEASRV